MKYFMFLCLLLISISSGMAQNARDMLIRASLTNDMGTAMTALGKGADLNDGDAMGRTPLMLAAKLGYTPLVIVYTDRGALVNAKDKEGITPLMFAARNNQIDPARVLASKDTDLEAKDKAGKTALMMAAELGHHEIMGLLLESGAKPVFTLASELETAQSDDVAENKNVTLLNAILNHNTEAALEAIRSGANPDVRNKRRIPAIVLAASRKQVEIVEALLDQGADVNSRANDESRGIAQITPLHVAAANGNADILRLLLSNGAMVNAQEKSGLTPLMSAAELGNIVNIILLVDRGAELNGQDHDGNSSLLFAVMNDNTDAARILLGKGADVNLADEEMTTPLMLAAQQGNLELVTLLLDSGANSKLRRGANGYRATDFARLNGYRDVAKYIKSRQ
ncbi:MAG TPA: ankyrin repeat domain-containing protein [Bacteroidetes bacterium]|nr:ankyrin repeat domain-containing protein [Bacteroidota bacterium]